jgi:hypothetical protein
MLDMIHYRKFTPIELHGQLPSSEKPTRYSYQKSNTSTPNQQYHYINMHFCIIFKSVCGSTVSTITTIYTEIFGVQILAGATDLSLLQNIYTISSTHPASNSMKTRAFCLAVK